MSCEEAALVSVVAEGSVLLEREVGAVRGIDGWGGEESLGRVYCGEWRH